MPFTGLASRMPNDLKGFRLGSVSLNVIMLSMTTFWFSAAVTRAALGINSGWNTSIPCSPASGDPWGKNSVRSALNVTTLPFVSNVLFLKTPFGGDENGRTA